MNDSLRLLHIEDQVSDHLLVVRNLLQHGVEAEVHRVDSYPDLNQALDQGGWDAILSDYSLPGMAFRTTLGLIRSREPDLPLILVSGSIGEEEALSLLRAGLTDFVLKDRPTRLAGALRQALEARSVLRSKRAAEHALSESESRLATLFRLSPVAIGVSRASDGRMVEVNEALLETFGLSREEALGRTAVELGFFTQAGDRERLMEALGSGDRVRNFTFQGQRKDGVVLDLLLSLDRIQIGGETFLFGMCSDITSLREAERAVTLSERRFRSLFDHMFEGVAHCRTILQDRALVDWEYLAANPAFTRVSGLKDVVGRRVSELMPTLREENPELFRRLELVVWTGVPAKYEIFIKPTGRWLSVSAYRPAPGEFVVVMENITERKVAEENLKASEVRFASVFQASPHGIVLSDLEDRKILDANPAFLGLLGRRLEEVVGRTSTELGMWMRPEERESAIQELRQSGRVNQRESELVTADGSLRTVLWSTEMVRMGARTLLVNLVTDLTDRKRAERERRQLEAELAHAQKLDSLGAMAGSMAHDMNNVLMAIMALASTLQVTHKDDPKVAKAMEALQTAAGRGRSLVKGLSDFARKDLQQAEPVDLNALAQAEADLLDRAAAQGVAVHLDLQAGLPRILGDRDALGNALMNLCVNALDAMPGGGTLTLGTRRLGPGEVELFVKDTGPGMAPEVAKRALEPFFTTKPAGKGTGLGLAQVYGVLKAHGGTVDLRSEPGAGTEVVLAFPLPQA